MYTVSTRVEKREQLKGNTLSALRSIRPFFRHHQRPGAHWQADIDVTNNRFNDNRRTYLIYVWSNRGRRHGLSKL